MRLFVASLSAFFLMLVCSNASGQEGGRTCEYDLECAPAQACNAQGRCVARGAIEEPNSSATDECGTDRRCRIDRLKRKNAAQRHAKIIEEERYVRRIIEDEEKTRLESIPRLADPLSADLRISRLGPLGLHAGYVFFGHLQPEFEFSYSDLYVWVPSTTESPTSISGYHQGWFLRGGLTYFLLKSWFSPYVSAGFQLGLGKFQNDNFFFDSFDNGTRTEFHAADVGAGVDFQIGFGLHTRLGLTYRPLIYNQARLGPGQYDDVARAGLERWYKRTVASDVVWLLGWAI